MEAGPDLLPSGRMGLSWEVVEIHCPEQNLYRNQTMPGKSRRTFGAYENQENTSDQEYGLCREDAPAHHLDCCLRSSNRSLTDHNKLSKLAPNIICFLRNWLTVKSPMRSVKWVFSKFISFQIVDI